MAAPASSAEDYLATLLAGVATPAQQLISHAVANEAQVRAVFAALKTHWNNCNDAQGGDGVLQLLFVIGDVGTSPAANYDGYNLTVNANNYSVIGTCAVISRTCSLRRWARAHASVLLTRAKTEGRSFRVGTLHGIPGAFAYLGFDFVDGVPSTKLTPAEQSAISCARMIGLFSAAQRTVVNTHAAFNPGSMQISSTPRPTGQLLIE